MPVGRQGSLMKNRAAITEFVRRWTDMLIARIDDEKVVEVSFGSKCGATDVFKRLSGA